MPETQQPDWKIVGKVGDVNPIEYGGGFVYEDHTGVYPPEVVYIQEAAEDVRNKVTVYRFILEREPEGEWWWEDLADVAITCDAEIGELQRMAKGSTMERAGVYMDVVWFYGLHEFDQYPVEMTEDEARKRYAMELDWKGDAHA